MIPNSKLSLKFNSFSYSIQINQKNYYFKIAEAKRAKHSQYFFYFHSRTANIFTAIPCIHIFPQLSVTFCHVAAFCGSGNSPPTSVLLFVFWTKKYLKLVPRCEASLAILSNRREFFFFTPTVTDSTIEIYIYLSQIG